MYRSLSSNRGNFIFILALALVLVVATSFVFDRLRPTPTVEVTDCYLTSDTIPKDGFTSITFTLKSNDDQESRHIRVEFSSHYLVTFMLGTKYLERENGLWYYEEDLNPSASHTQSINVRASLESGIAEITYGITINFYMDGQQFYDKKLDLKVQD